MQFVRFFYKKIAKTFSNYFTPINFYKLCLKKNRDNLY